MTNNLRLYLWIALGALLYFNYDAWMRDYGPRPEAVSPSGANSAVAQAAKAATDLANQVPQAEVAPAQQAAAGTTTTATAPASTADRQPGVEPAASVVHVRTDVLNLDISTRGGTIQRADLSKYPKVKGEETPVRLENVDDPLTQYVLQSGLTGGSANTPTHLTLYTAERSDYQIDSSDELQVPLTWESGGVSVTKTFIFHRGKYRIDVRYSVQNHSDSAWQAAQYAQILRNDPRTKSSMFNFNAEKSQFHGPAIWDGGKYRKLNFNSGDDSHLSIPVQNGWIAAIQHHFVTAVVPQKDQSFHFTLSASGDEYVLGARGPLETVAPGAQQTFGETFFIGPKLQGELSATSPELARVADYGYLYILAEPLFWLLAKAHSITGNWGVAIIAITILLKLLFYPLSEASGRSMAKMKALAPRIKNLQETYKDDREKIGKATMELYQREKVNPVAGCLPMILQIPVFLAFYWTLLESVEMRQAPFAGWLHDLSSPDPFYILPAIMAASMLVQFKLNPAPADPTQAKIMMIMPLVMSVTFAFFPSGVVLYWVTNTLLTMAQQWNINRRIAAAPSKKN